MIEKVKDKYLGAMYRLFETIRNRAGEYRCGYASAEFHTTKDWLETLLTKSEMEEFEDECIAKMATTFGFHTGTVKFLIR